MNENIFPNAFVIELTNAILRIDPSFVSTNRPLRPDDPHGSVGIFESNWQPIAHEISGELHDPAVQRYILTIQTMAKHLQEPVGRGLGSYMAKCVRLMLYRDPTLRSNLAALIDTSMGVSERVTKFDILQQDFAPINLDNQFHFVSNTTMYVETRVHFA